MFTKRFHLTFSFKTFANLFTQCFYSKFTFKSFAKAMLFIEHSHLKPLQTCSLTFSFKTFPNMFTQCFYSWSCKVLTASSSCLTFFLRMYWYWSTDVPVANAMPQLNMMTRFWRVRLMTSWNRNQVVKNSLITVNLIHFGFFNNCLVMSIIHDRRFLKGKTFWQLTFYYSI